MRFPWYIGVMKTRKRCDANHANRYHSARCGFTTFLLRSAPMRIESLALLDGVTREDDGVPSARVLGAPLLESEAVHHIARVGDVLVVCAGSVHHATSLQLTQHGIHTTLHSYLFTLPRTAHILFRQVYDEGHGIGVVVYLRVVGHARQARGILALFVVVATREALVVFVDGEKH